MYKKQKSLKTFLTSNPYNSELFSRNAMNTIIRALLEPVANKNINALMFTRLKNKEGIDGLIKRLEYCNNVEIIDVLNPSVLIKDDYIEIEFLILTSARYNFVLIWDYSSDAGKKYTKVFFLANSSRVNDAYEILQNNLNMNYREKFYRHKPERRENEILNEAFFNVIKKLNLNMEENFYKTNSDFTDLKEKDNMADKIRETSHEIKNQLSILDIYTRLIEKQAGLNKYVNIMKKAYNAIGVSLNELRNLEEPVIKEIILQDIIQDSLKMLKEVAAQNRNKIAFDKKYNFDIKVKADENKLLSVFNNIVKNANESTTKDTITFELNLDKHSVSIDIKNHGAPIPVQNQKKIFDKGYTTKLKGAGIGLYSCKKNIEAFRGKLELVNSNRKETVFRITLPLI